MRKSLKMLATPANVDLEIEWVPPRPYVDFTFHAPRRVPSETSEDNFGWRVHAEDDEDSMYVRPTLGELQQAGYNVTPLRKLGKADDELVRFIDLCAVDRTGFLFEVLRCAEELDDAFSMADEALDSLRSRGVLASDTNENNQKMRNALVVLTERLSKAESRDDSASESEQPG